MIDQMARKRERNQKGLGLDDGRSRHSMDHGELESIELGRQKRSTEGDMEHVECTAKAGRWVTIAITH
jgi:hypothetical protein